MIIAKKIGAKRAFLGCALVFLLALSCKHSADDDGLGNDRPDDDVIVGQLAVSGLPSSGEWTASVFRGAISTANFGTVNSRIVAVGGGTAGDDNAMLIALKTVSGRDFVDETYSLILANADGTVSKYKNSVVFVDGIAETNLSDDFFNTTGLISGVADEELAASAEQSLGDILTGIKTSAASYKNYIISVSGDEEITPEQGLLDYPGMAGITVTLTGGSAERVIRLKKTGADNTYAVGVDGGDDDRGSLFTVGRNVTLVLGSNITLKGITKLDAAKFTMLEANEVQAYQERYPDDYVSENNAPLVKVNFGGMLEMKGSAKITGNAVNTGANAKMQDAGGVFVAGGIFSMGDDTEISYNASQWEGGAVCMSGGEFTMSGNAALKYNFSEYYGGGAAIVNSGVFVMKDNAKITRNIVKVYYGGGVYMDFSTFTLSGNGEISYNKVATSGNASGGGGVFANTNSVFTMQGEAKVAHNELCMQITNLPATGGGGVYVSGTFNMEGGTIEYNTNKNIGQGQPKGGGFCSGTTSCTFNMSGGTIQYNEAYTEDAPATPGNGGIAMGGGVYAQNFNMTGGIIRNNTARSSGTGNGKYAAGGGVYITARSKVIEGEISGNLCEAPLPAQILGSAIFVPYQTQLYLGTGAHIPSGTDGLQKICLAKYNASTSYPPGQIVLLDTLSANPDNSFKLDLQYYTDFNEYEGAYRPLLLWDTTNSALSGDLPIAKFALGNFVKTPVVPTTVPTPITMKVLDAATGLLKDPS